MKFELPDGLYSVSDIQDYIKDIIKKHETLRAISTIHVYINRINKRLVFEIKDQAFIQAFLSIAIFPHRFSFFTVCLVQWLLGMAPWWTMKGKFEI